MLKHAYQALIWGDTIEGDLSCPKCLETHLHPTGHTRQIERVKEYGPIVGVAMLCECGQASELRIGNYKGNLGMDLVELDWP